MGVPYKGAIYSVCETPQPSDLDQAGFEALTFVAVAGTLTLPESGITDSMVSQQFVSPGVDQNYKGHKSAGVGVTLELGSLPEDDGQIALKAMAATRFNYAYKIELADRETGLGTNTFIYNRGVVGGPVNPFGGGEDFHNLTFIFGFNQEPVTVDRT